MAAVALVAGGVVAGTSAPVEASNATTLVIGDSLCVGAIGALDSLLSASGTLVDSDCMTGRRLEVGAEILEASTNSYGTIIVVLGTNVAERLVMRAAVDRIIAASNGAAVRFVQPYVEADFNFRLVGLNEYTGDVSAAHDSVEVCSWPDIVSGQPGIFGPDGVHYTESGSDVFASYLEECIGGDVAESAPMHIGPRSAGIALGWMNTEVTDSLGASANAENADEVEWLVDGVVVATDSSEPFTMFMDASELANGPHVLVARTLDAVTGEWVSTPDASFTKSEPPATTTTTTPLAEQVTTIRHGWVGVNVSNWLWSSAFVEHADEVEWLVDGVLVFTDSSAPFAVSMDSAQFSNGDHVLMARTRDSVSGEWVTTPEVTFTKDGPTAPATIVPVTTVPTSSVPTTSISVPTVPVATVPTTSVPATTIPVAGVTTIRHGWIGVNVSNWLWSSAFVEHADEVEWLVDGVLVFTDSSAPFAVSMDSAQFSNGDHVLMARTRDSVSGEWVTTPEVTFTKDGPTAPTTTVPVTTVPTATTVPVPTATTVPVTTVPVTTVPATTTVTTVPVTTVPTTTVPTGPTPSIRHGWVDASVTHWMWAAAVVEHGTEVEWLVDGVVVFTDSSAPFAISMPATQFSPGEHSLVARTFDDTTGDWVTTPQATFIKS